MNTTLRSTLLVLATVVALPAQAAIQNWSFSGTLESGAYAGATFSGTARFDDAVLTGIGEEWIALDAIDLTFLGQSYSTLDAAAVPEAAFADGAFLGLGYVVEAGDPKFALIAGFASRADAYFAYDTVTGLSGTGSLSFAPAVPEPEGWALMLAGLIGVAGAARRVRR